MDLPGLEEMLRKVRDGALSPEEAARRLRDLSVEDMGFARLDHGRGLRCGFPEVVFCQGKRPEEAALLGERIFEKSGKVLLTRATREVFQLFQARVPEAAWHERARCVTARRPGLPAESTGMVAVLAAGTADLPVAEEARVTAEMMGARVRTFYDVGVAGIHRLLEHVKDLRGARALVVAAGMEGALPSVVAGLVDRPVLAVPTSVGYGASFGGLSALLAMLNSCAAGVAVVNIDNGFGAGFLAALINRNGTT